ncbi:TPA: TniQ family protein [Bacillus thuringiensis]|nr:TniQ family protein [Bacillus thuringiensis]
MVSDALKRIKLDKENVYSNRTMLYGLEPLRVYTPLIESMTSYICRLAFAHNITVKNFIQDIIRPNMKLLENEVGRVSALKINVGGEYSKKLAKVLYTLTGQIEILGLPYWSQNVRDKLILLGEPLPYDKLLTERKRWCPQCFMEWMIQGLPLYEPVVWNKRTVRSCWKHEILLHNTCSFCSEGISYFTPKIRIGFCPYCNHFLS